MNEERYDYLFKLLLLGRDHTGKTSLLSRYYDDSFFDRVIATIGLDFKIKTINLDNKIIRTQIWDTAGQESFHDMVKHYYKNTHGYIFVYDVTDQNTFKNVIRLIEEIETNGLANIKKILIGNKIDLPNRIVTEEQGKKLAEQHNMCFFETSAKTGENVKEAFNYLIKEILNSIPEKEEINKLKNKEKSGNKINLESLKIIEDKYNEEVNKNKKLEEENKRLKEKLKTIINCHLEEINRLRDDLLKANKLISNYQKNELKNVENSSNNNNDENNKSLIDEILNLKNQLNNKENEIEDLKQKLKKYSLPDDKISINDIIVLNFVSADQNIHYGIKCLKTDIFAEVEEKLYKIYDNYRNTNNICYANAKSILRFKKVCENDIKDGDMIQIIKME